MRVGKVSNSKSDLHGHSRSIQLVPFDRPHVYDFLFVCHCDYVSILYHFQDITSYLPKIKDVT